MALDDEAGVVLVDVQLPVEPEELGVGAEEALDVRLRRKRRELLVLQRLMYFERIFVPSSTCA